MYLDTEEKEDKVEIKTKKISSKKYVLLFLKLFFITLVVLLLQGLIPPLLTFLSFNLKYGEELITELFFAFLVIVVLLISKNGSILHKKREGAFKGIKYGITLFVVAVIIFLGNTTTGGNTGLGILINLALFCFAIGCAEEFLCRGYLQNEFLKKFGNSRKGVILSILGSSLVFGAIHLTNIFAGQTILETLLQVLQTTSLGFLLGVVYYRTGNIWSVVLLHGFYDFAIMLGESGNYVDCTTLSNPSLQNTIFGLVTSSIIVILYLVNAFKYLDKEGIDAIIKNRSVNKEKIDVKRNKKYNRALIITAICFFVFPAFIHADDNYSVCYKFDKMKVKDNYELRYPNKETYQISYNENVLNFYLDKDDNLVVENPTDGNTLVIMEDILDYIVVDSNDSYYILTETATDTTYERHLVMLEKNNLSTTNEYLESIKDNFNEIVTPDVYSFGYIYINDGEEVYPFIRTNLNDIFIVKNKDSILILE